MQRSCVARPGAPVPTVRRDTPDTPPTARHHDGFLVCELAQHLRLTRAGGSGTTRPLTQPVVVRDRGPCLWVVDGVWKTQTAYDSQHGKFAKHCGEVSRGTRHSIRGQQRGR